MKAKLVAIAKRYRPNGVSIKFRRDEYLTPAHAQQFADGSKVMYVPRPTTTAALYVYLHECAHHHLGHCKPDYREPLWLQEYEAEQWAIATMRREGVPVPRAMIWEAKKYVKECADIDAKKGRRPPPAKVVRWMTRRFKQKPKPIKNLRRPKHG